VSKFLAIFDSLEGCKQRHFGHGVNKKKFVLCFKWKVMKANSLFSNHAFKKYIHFMQIPNRLKWATENVLKKLWAKTMLNFAKFEFLNFSAFVNVFCL
jgi:hypothetical protein